MHIPENKTHCNRWKCI